MDAHDGAVLVGLGDERHGERELTWAAREAQARHRRLRVVRAWSPASGTLPWNSSVDRLIERDLRRLASHRVDIAIELLRTRWPQVPVEADVVEGMPAKAVVHESESAALTVVGSRGLGSVQSAVVGSVSTVVAARASGPVVVVRNPPTRADGDGGVVVGVDGSDLGQDALAFAFEYASTHHLPLRAIFCWEPPLSDDDWRRPAFVTAEADRWLAEDLAGWQEKYPDVEVRRDVVLEHPADGLVHESHGQDLLVVASKSHHPHVAGLLGSVSQAVLHHATCPIAIVHPRVGG